MAKYLDNEGLTYFTEKMKKYADGKVGAVDKKVTSHVGNKQNPHGVTKAQVGLGSVDNVQQIPLSQKGAVNGVATLDANGKIPVAQMPENGELSASLYKIVDALPTTGIDTSKIYLVPASATTAKNNKTEYIYLGDPNKAYDESKWEKLGDEQKSSTVTTPGGSITVDTALIENSPNPVAGGVVKAKTDEIDGKLAKKVESSDYNTKMTAIDSTLKELGNKTINVDTELKDSPNPVQNRAVNTAVNSLNTKLGNKADSTALTTAIGRISTLETDAATKVIETGEGNGISGISKSGNTITAEKGNFLTSAAGLATKNDILPDTLASKGIATQTWVNGRGFATGTIPTNVSQLNNDSGFLTDTALAGYVNEVKEDITTSGNGIAGITKVGKVLKVTKSTFLTAHQSLDGYVNNVKVTGVANGNGIASIAKNGKDINVTQGAFLTAVDGIIAEAGNAVAGKGITDISIRGNKLVKKTGTFVTSETLGTSIDKYASDKGYLTKENLKESLKETITIRLVSDKSASDTNLNGVTVTVKSGDTTVSTQTWQGTPIEVKVPCDKEVTIEAAVVKMYVKPKVLKYVPSPLYNREVTITYKALETGVFIIDKNDKTYKTEEEFIQSGTEVKDIIGALLVTNNVAIVVANYVSDYVVWGPNGLVDGCTVADSETVAAQDFAGAANTAAIIKTFGSSSENIAAAICHNYIFKNGRRGHLMSAGEAVAIQKNITTINEMMSNLGIPSTNIITSEKYYWTSTQASGNQHVFRIYGYSSTPKLEIRNNVNYAVPIYSLYD